jgi:dTDP-4-dehydrorhamnose reductase
LKILLIGKTGQLGWELARSLAPLGELTAVDRRALDLADVASIAAAVRGVRPQLIVNAAAFTAVDRAQAESAAAHTVNAAAPGILAREARALGAALVHFSTDYVFSGDKSGAYVEDDRAAPASVYGQSKLAGEQAVSASGVAHLILRTSWVYAARGSNFLLTMLRLARTKAELAVVADQFGAPTWARMIAEATALVIARCGGTPQAILDTLGRCGGVYHLSAAGRTSWHGFAEAIMQEAGLAAKVRAIATAEYPLPAPRPANSLLATGKIEQQFGISLPRWEMGLKLCVEELGLRTRQNGVSREPVR